MRFRNIFICAALGLSALALAQDRDRYDRDRYWDGEHERFTVLVPGTVLPVRTTETIDVERYSNRVYPGVVDQDVFGENGRLAIPRGSRVELMVRVAPDNDLVLDLDSVIVGDQRYAVRSTPNRFESERDNSVVGGIIGAITGAQVRGPAVVVAGDTVLTFRLDQPLEMGVPDRGYDRDGFHYHEYRR